MPCDLFQPDLIDTLEMSKVMFNINDNKRYRMIFEPSIKQPPLHFFIAGSWEPLDSEANFSLLFDNSSRSTVYLLFTVSGVIESCANLNFKLSLNTQLYGSFENPIKTIGTGLQLNYQPANPLINSRDYEVSLEIPPRSLLTGMHYLYPQIEAECDGENLGVICTGQKVTIQVLDLTY